MRPRDQRQWTILWAYIAEVDKSLDNARLGQRPLIWLRFVSVPVPENIQRQKAAIAA